MSLHDLTVYKEGENWFAMQTPMRDLTFSVNWEGCCHVRAYANGTNEDEPLLDGTGENQEDYLHICDIDAFIMQLQQVKAEALKRNIEA